MRALELHVRRVTRAATGTHITYAMHDVRDSRAAGRDEHA